MPIYSNSKIITDADFVESSSWLPARLYKFAAAHVNTSRVPLVARIRFQLAGGLVFSMLPPMLIKADAVLSTSQANAIDTFLGVLFAIVIGFYALRRISSFPAIKDVGSVVPVFTMSFLAVIGWFFFFRLEYSRFQFVSAYLLALVWFTGVFVVSQRLAWKRFAVVPVGEAVSICELPGADWRVIAANDPLPASCAGIVADLRADLPGHWEQFITASVLGGTPVYHFKQVREQLTGRLEIEHLSENILGSHDPHHDYLKFKRVVDTLAAVAATALLSPLLIAVAVLIRLDSKGPALFKQARVRRGGSVFTIYKFRTMYAAPPVLETGGSSEAIHPVDAAITRQNDMRVTRVGAFLRRTRIDELPQIINILKGEMSWIGPRPEAVALTQWYQEQLPFYHYRHIVPPGITGWAQVNQGHVTDPRDVLGKLHYDFFYIKNFSFWLDVLIVLKTVRTMLTGFGAR